MLPCDYAQHSLQLVSQSTHCTTYQYTWYHKAYKTVSITMQLKTKYHIVGTVPKCNCKIVKKWQCRYKTEYAYYYQYTIHLLSCNTQYTCYHTIHNTLVIIQYTCYHATQNILVTIQHTLNILPF